MDATSVRAMMDRLISSIPFTLNGYHFESVLGRGGFSTVFKTVHLNSSHVFAAKACFIEEGNKRNVALTEINSLKQLYHPNIIKVYDTFEKDNFVFIILEYMDGGSLKNIIPAKGLKHHALLSCIYQLLKAVEFCHVNGIAHRDIKPENILFDSTGRCVLSDFGLSHTLESSKVTDDFSGSLPFKSPEILKHLEHDPIKADMWAVGVTVYCLAVGALPWTICDSVRNAIINKIFILPRELPPYIQYIVQYTLLSEPEKRFSATRLLSLSVFNSQIKLVPLEEKRMSLTIGPLSSPFKTPSKRRRRCSSKLSSYSSCGSIISSFDSDAEKCESSGTSSFTGRPMIRGSSQCIICPPTFVDNINAESSIFLVN